MLIYINLYFVATQPQQRQTETTKERKYRIYTKNAYKAKSHKLHSVSNCLDTALATAPTWLHTETEYLAKQYITTVLVHTKQNILYQLCRRIFGQANDEFHTSLISLVANCFVMIIVMIWSALVYVVYVWQSWETEAGVGTTGSRTWTHPAGTRARTNGVWKRRTAS